MQEIHRQVHTMHVAHRRAEADAARHGRELAVAIAVLSAITGTSIFATLQTSPALGWRIAVGVLAVVAAGLGAVQSSVAFGQQQAQHRSAAEAFGTLRRDLETHLFFERHASGEAWLEDWEAQWNKVDAGAPAVSNSVYRKAEDDVKQRETV